MRNNAFWEPWESDKSDVQARHLFHHADEYIQRGWPVIPLLGKTPAVCWKEFQSRRPTPQEIQAWFKSENELNIGIVTGRVSELVVVDADSNDEAAWWISNYPKSSLMVHTGRGGMHIYYRMPELTLGNRTRLFGRAIDLRGNGGYVVAPPSIHPETRKPYSWAMERWEEVSLLDIPVFDSTWVAERPKTSSDSGGTLYSPQPLLARSSRTWSRIEGIVQYLRDTESLPDRSARDFGSVMLLLRLGCSIDEIRELVKDVSKFRDNEAYLERTISQALKAFQE